MYKCQANLTFSTVASKANWTSMGQNLHIYNEDYFVLLWVIYNLLSCKNSAMELDGPKWCAIDDAQFLTEAQIFPAQIADRLIYCCIPKTRYRVDAP